MDELIRFDVGGRKFKTWRSTILKHPESVLAKHIGDLGKRDKNGRYFIDRDPDVFTAILSYYRNDILACPPQVNLEVFEAELRFWGLNSSTDVPSLESILKISILKEEYLIRSLSDDHIIRFIYDAYLNQRENGLTSIMLYLNPLRNSNLILPFGYQKKFGKMALEEQIQAFIKTMKMFFNFNRVSHETPIVNNNRFTVNGFTYTVNDDTYFFMKDGKQLINLIVGYS